MLHKQKLFLTVVIAIMATLPSAVSTSFAGSGPNMDEGLWEITTKMEMPGMPVSMPSSTHTQCLTNENLVPRGSEQGKDCAITTTKVDGDTVTWAMECDSPEGKAKANGEIKYKGDTFEGTIHMTMQGMEMTQRISRRRIGNCTL